MNNIQVKGMQSLSIKLADSDEWEELGRIQEIASLDQRVNELLLEGEELWEWMYPDDLS